MADSLYIEQRIIRRGSLSQDIASHLFARQWYGTSIVVCDKPKVMLSSVMKQWVELTRKVQRHRASTLNTDRIQELSRVFNHMEHLRMAAQSSIKQGESDVIFVTSRELTDLPGDCQTAYIACADPEPVIDRVQRMLDAGVIVYY